MKITITKSNTRRFLALVLFPFIAGTAIGKGLASIERTLDDGEPEQIVVERPQPTPIAELPETKNLLVEDPSVAANWGINETESWKAWNLSRGSRGIVVAIIDTGIDVRHPDLVKNLWRNPGESGLDELGRDKASNGIDDDRNGYVDDVHGWNFVDDDNVVTDNHGHGTHIAGIIGANGEGAGGLGGGIRGVAPNVSLMVLKYFDPRARSLNPLANTIKAIRYAMKMNAKIINYSGGGLLPNQLEMDVIREAAERGILVVAAAGNERSNSDRRGFYPADYDLPNVLSVTAIDKQQRILPTSNYGERSVDIAAPGDEITSTVPGGYAAMTGTSQATAFATGVAVLLMAQRPELRDPAALIKHIVETGGQVEKLIGKTRRQTVLNSYRALAIFDRSVAAFGEAASNADGIDPAPFSR